MADAPAVMIAALSGRALAAAACRAGYRPLVADLFQDLDTRRLAGRTARLAGDLGRGIAADALACALDELGRRETSKPVGLVYGAGFEDCPALVAGLPPGLKLLGNGPEQLDAVNDPRRFFALLDRLAIPHPGVSFVPPAEPRGWLVKQTAASGGAHVRPARDAVAPHEGHYFQRRVKGRPISALFLADGARARVLGFSEQWPSAAGPRSPFRFGGAVQPATLVPGLAEALAEAARRIVTETGLVGLNSADFMVRGGAFDLLEINPRPGATLDIFDQDASAPLFGLHCRACSGVPPDAWQAPARATACAILYARRKVRIPHGFRWPRWTADRPAVTTRIGRGEPICTVLAQGRGAEDARGRVLRRAGTVLAGLEARRPGPADARLQQEAAVPWR